MKKADRELIFNKYKGKCAYCGIELVKGWHIDELLPVVRKQKWIKAGWYNKITNQPKAKHEIASNNPDFEWKEERWVSDGCQYPENFNTANQMPACASCNINKHSMSLDEFRQLISGFMKHLNEINTQYKIAKRYGLVVENIKPIVFYFESITPH